MDVEDFLRAGNIAVDIEGADIFRATEPQQPTSDRIKELLNRVLTTPWTLTPEEIRELCGSVAYRLLVERFG